VQVLNVGTHTQVWGPSQENSEHQTLYFLHYGEFLCYNLCIFASIYGVKGFYFLTIKVLWLRCELELFYRCGGTNVHALNIGGHTYDMGVMGFLHQNILSIRHFISCIMVNCVHSLCHFASIYSVQYIQFSKNKRPLLL